MCHRRCMTASARGEADRPALAARFVTGPHLFAPDSAPQNLESWLADLAPEHAAAICDRTAAFPYVGTMLEGIAQASPYLFDLMRADAARLIRLLDCEPELYLANLI